MNEGYDFDFSRYLSYNELSPTGLVWNPRKVSDFKTMVNYHRFHRELAGEPAGCLVVNANGYKLWRLILLKENYTNSRIIYSMKIGPIDEEDLIDHIDGNSLNNRWRNLRIATTSQNYANSKMQKNNKSGYKGVTLRKSGRFEANINNDYLGSYLTPEEANEAYHREAVLRYGEFARSK